LLLETLKKNKIYSQNLRVIFNTQWLLFDKFLRIGIGILLNAWMARFLGTEDFGILRYAVSLVSLFIPLAELGLSTIAVREFLNLRSQKYQLVGTIFSLKLAAAAAVAVIGCGVVAFFIDQEENLLRLLILIISCGMLFQAFDVIDYWFQSRIESKFVVIAKSAAFIISASIKVFLLLSHASLIAFGMALIADSILNATALIIVFQWRKNHLARARISLELAKKLLHSSSPLIFSGIMKIVFLRIDQVMIKNMLDASELGIYSAAVQLSEGFFFIPMILHSSVFPTIVEAKEQSLALFYQRLQTFYNTLALLGYIIAIAITISSSLIVGVLYGPEYGRSANLLAVLIWSVVFINLGVGRSAFLISMDMTKFHLFSMTGACILNISLNLTLIPVFGLTGAAIASILSYGFAGYFSSFLYRPLFRTGMMLTKSMLYPKFW